MSDSPSVPQKKPVRPLNRWGVGALSVFQTALLVVIVIAGNYLAVNHYARLDLSSRKHYPQGRSFLQAVRDFLPFHATKRQRMEDLDFPPGNYSLSPATTRYLKSDAVRGREKPVKWIMAYRRTSPFHERSRAFAEEYARLSKGKIKLEVVDPLRSPDRVQEVTAAYGISLARDLIIIDARSDDSPVSTEDVNRVKTLNPHVRLVVAEDMAVYATAEGKRKITGYQGEDVLTAALVGAIEGKPRKMALLADKSRLEAREGASPRKSFEDLLRFQNVELAELQLSSLEAIPDDVAGIVLAAPQYDLTDAELAVLENYWNRPRAAILVLADPAGVPLKLRAFLRTNGITPRDDRVITREKETLVTAARGVFTKGVRFTRDLSGQSTEFGGASSSLEVREGAEDLLNKRIQPMGLIQVSDGFWGETKFGKGGEVFDEMEDHEPPMYLAASVTRGAESDDRFAADSSRMIVISNTDFLDPAHRRAENLDFLASSVNWLIGREQLAGIGPRSLDNYKLPLLDAQVSFINLINLFFLPAFLLLIGAFVWSSRRV